MPPHTSKVRCMIHCPDCGQTLVVAEVAGSKMQGRSLGTGRGKTQCPGSCETSAPPTAGKVVISQLQPLNWLSMAVDAVSPRQSLRGTRRPWS